MTRAPARMCAALAWARRSAPALGQSMVEYAIIAALVAVVALGAVRLLGGSVSTTFTHVQECVNDANSSAGSGSSSC